MTRREAISPVIATVIIVAVTIAVAIAVAFWMTGIIGLFTGFEQIQIVNIYDTKGGIFLVVKNTGTQKASITDIYINGRSCVNVLKCEFNGTANVKLPFTVDTGKTIAINITKIPSLSLTPGVSVEVKLYTAAGKEYPKLIVLQEYSSSP